MATSEPQIMSLIVDMLGIHIMFSVQLYCVKANDIIHIRLLTSLVKTQERPSTIWHYCHGSYFEHKRWHC